MNPVAGLGPLLRVALRRDRIMLPTWLFGLFGFAYVSAVGTVDLFVTPESRAAFAAGVGHNPATIALYGPSFDLATIGALATWKMSGLGSALLALLSLLTVVRHTRAEEEAGRLELLGATVVGRYAALSAAVLVAAGTGLLAGPVVALGLVAGGVPAAGTLSFGLTLSAAALCFTAVAAVAAQLTESSRAANRISLATLLAAYLLRAVGDTSGPGWLSWLSPIGWSQQVRPWGEPRWWVFALAGGFTVLVAMAGYGLVARRDLGAGLLPARPGPAQAGPWLAGPLGLAWRLHRATFVGWLTGFVVLGLFVGSLAATISDLVGGSQAVTSLLADLGGGQQSIVDAAITVYFGIMGLAASAYAVQATLRLRSEESAGRAEPLLAAALGRPRWAGSHLGLAALGSAALLVAAGLAGGIMHGLRTSDPGTQLPRVLGAALVEIPAAWVLAGITVALFGLAPRLAVAAWAVLAAFLTLGQLGPLLRLPQWAMDLSPFTHLPKLPGADLAATPLLWLTVISVALAGVGLLTFRRRDLT